MSTQSTTLSLVIILCNPELGLTLDEVLTELGGIKETTLRSHVLTARKAGANVLMPPAEKDMTKRMLTYLRVRLDTADTTDTDIVTYHFIGERLRKEQSPEMITLVNRLCRQRKKLVTDLRKTARERDLCTQALAAIQCTTKVVLGDGVTDGPKLSAALFKRCDELDLSARSTKYLKTAGIEYIWQLVERTEAEMLKVKNLGRKQLVEIKELLAEIGLELGTKLGNPPKEEPQT